MQQQHEFYAFWWASHRAQKSNGEFTCQVRDPSLNAPSWSSLHSPNTNNMVLANKNDGGMDGAPCQ